MSLLRRSQTLTSLAGAGTRDPVVSSRRYTMWLPLSVSAVALAVERTTKVVRAVTSRCGMWLT